MCVLIPTNFITANSFAIFCLIYDHYLNVNIVLMTFFFFELLEFLSKFLTFFTIFSLITTFSFLLCSFSLFWASGSRSTSSRVCIRFCSQSSYITHTLSFGCRQGYIWPQFEIIGCKRRFWRWSHFFIFTTSRTKLSTAASWVRPTLTLENWSVVALWSQRLKAISESHYLTYFPTLSLRSVNFALFLPVLTIKTSLSLLWKLLSFQTICCGGIGVRTPALTRIPQSLKLVFYTTKAIFYLFPLLFNCFVARKTIAFG